MNTLGSSREVKVRVPAKVNLQLSVGPVKSDGYHDVVSVFQAISLFDDVIVREGGSGISLTVKGSTSSGVPIDNRNLAFAATQLMIERFSINPNLEIELYKEIPVAGGMAGGSADAGAVIVALDSLFSLGLSRTEMEKIGAELGSDVPFSITGGVAIGTGRGDQLTPALAKGTYHWVLAMSSQGLSTPAVYAECDRLREGLPIASPQISDGVMQALRAGDPVSLGAALVNDLQPAATSLRPALRLILDLGRDYGALGSIVSGSGPTVAFLVEDADRALDLIVALSSSGVIGSAVRAFGPVHGARVIDDYSH